MPATDSPKQPVTVGSLLSGINPTVVEDPNRKYSLQDAPLFLRDTLPMDQIKIEQGNVDAMTGLGAEHRKATAYVSPKNPHSIEVLDPSTFQQAQLNHELSHAFQDQLPPTVQFAAPNPESLYYGASDPAYISHNADPAAYSKEQLARMVENQTQKWSDLQAKAKSGKLYKEDVDDYLKWRSALAPVISKFASLSGKNYQAPQMDKNMLYDLPEFSTGTLPIPENIQGRPLTTLQKNKVNTGVF